VAFRHKRLAARRRSPPRPRPTGASAGWSTGGQVALEFARRVLPATW